MGDILDGYPKRVILRKVVPKENIYLELIIAVGDGDNYLEIFPSASLGDPHNARWLLLEFSAGSLFITNFDV